MITLDMCLKYIENKIFTKTGKQIQPLTPAQKKFLGNLCEGKLTDTPRNFGKSFLIELYAECLNYYVDQVKYTVKPDDYISLEEMLEGYNGFAPLLNKNIVDAYDCNSERAMREYNFKEEDLEWLK